MSPGRLPAGTHAFQGIGHETLTTDLTGTAAAGAANPEPKNEAAAAVTPRDRSGVELGIIAILLILAVAGGLLLVTKAERFGHAAQP